MKANKRQPLPDDPKHKADRGPSGPVGAVGSGSPSGADALFGRDPAASSTSATLEGGSGSRERARVLLADDNADMRDYLWRLLAPRYEVQAVADGQAALAAARAERPDLVLADILMPGMDGIELLHALRADPDLRTVPVILISARTQEHARAEGLEQGADDYIIKPFSPRELLARIGTQLEMARIRREALHEIEALLEENRGQRQLLQQLFEHAMDAIILADPAGQGRVLAVNPAACRLFGYSADEFAGLSRAALFSLGEPNLDVLLQRRAAAGQAVAVLRYRRKDGSEFLGELSTATFTIGDGEQNAVSIIRDITARMQAEEALRESERLYRELAETLEVERSKLAAAIDTLPVGIGLTDMQGTTLSMNEAGLRAHGFTSMEEMLAQLEDYQEQFELRDLDGVVIPPQEWPAARVLRGEPVQEYELWLRNRRAGTERIVSYSAVPVRNAAGEPLMLLYVMQDITERKQAEEALRRYAERLRFLHEVDEAILGAHSAVEVARAVVERVPRLLPCRRASVVMYEPEAKEVSLLAAYQDSGHGEPGQIWQGAADVPWEQVLERLAQGQEYEVADVQALSTDSPLVALLQEAGVRALVYEPIVINGQIIGALKLALDVPGPLSDERREVIHELAVQLTIGLEQARLYEEVRRDTVKLEHLVQQRTAALRASEERFRTIFEEAAIGIALAEPDGTLVATNPALRQMLGYSEQDLVGIRFFDLLAGGHSDKGELPPEVLAGQYDDYTQELEYVRKDGEKGEANVIVSLLREGGGEPALLLALIEDITARKRAQDALIQTERLAIMGRMAASLAHEVNNPVQSVVGCLGLAMEVMAEGKDASEYMTVAMDELERAARIVNRMRDLGRQEEGRRERGNVAELVEKVMVLTEKQAQNEQVQVIWEKGTGLPPVPMVPDQIQQVFLNLVLNAIDAMPQGGELRIRAARTEGPPGVQVSFADTGMGIAPEHIEHLFEAFHSNKQVGLGLGLFVSRNIVQDHEGWIDVQSELGKGTTFTVWLPAA